MRIRSAALSASSYDEQPQQATAFHEERLAAILEGDHLLSEVPDTIVHIVPETSLDGTRTFARAETPHGRAPVLSNRRQTRRNRPDGTVTSDVSDGGPTAYTLISWPGVVEAATARFKRETGDDGTQYFPSNAETGITALVNWAQEQYADYSGADSLDVCVTLNGLGGSEAYLTDRQAAGVMDETTFESDLIAPVPFRVETGDVTPQETHEELHTLFTHMWGGAGLSTNSYSDAGRIPGDVREYR